MAARHPLATSAATHSATPSHAKMLEIKLLRVVARSAQLVAATMSAKKTAWHPPFTSFLQERCPRWAKVTGEVQLTTEPLRVDDVIAVRADRDHDPSDTGTTLRGMWRFVVVVALLEYKSVVWPAQRGDVYRLFAYGMLWLSEHQRRERRSDGSRDERLAAHEVTLLLAVPSINDAIRDELDELGLALPTSDDGYHFVTGAPLPMLVIDLGVVCEREDDDVLRAFAGHHVRTLAAQRWMRQNQSVRSQSMSNQATPDLEGYEEFVAFMLDGLSPEERLMGLTTQQRLAGLAPSELRAALPPSERLADLALDEAILAMPDAALRGLTEEFIATLRDDVQAAVRARRNAR